MSISIDDLPNKKSLEQDLAAQMDGGRTVSLIFVDLDGFKQVNDQHGHPEGDKCLMESAVAMSKVINGKGRLYRPGGDEFCIILPDRSGSDAAVDAEHVRLSIGSLKPFGGISKVTASVGVATGYSGEGEHRFRGQAERRSGAKVNSSRSEATLA
jgi:diguanylate cyclase (GGDEF)-like protein